MTQQETTMPDHLSGLPRPRTIVHPGPYGARRIEHMQAEHGRHFRLSLPRGRSLYDSIVQALASVDVHNASMTLIDGDLEALSYCLAQPDASGRLVATYSAPHVVHDARFIFGNATLGKSAAGSSVIHCHAVFRTAEGDVRGGHVLTEKAIVGASPIKVVATALDGFDLRIGYDEETRMPLMRPQSEDRHV
jgi:predicted DNA-binding protein with PD1-like motif